MLLKIILLSLQFFPSAEIAPANSVTALPPVSISTPRALSHDIEQLVKLDPGERIEVDKSLFWHTGLSKFYFLAVSNSKNNHGCRFVFVDGVAKKTISDGGFNFERCTFTKPPEVLDINGDGYMDFKVWIKLPHHAGSTVFVNHSVDFIYDPRAALFCERNLGIPCTSQNMPTQN